MTYFKTFILLVISLFLITGCGGEESNVANDLIMDNVDDISSDNLVSMGSFSGQNGYSTSGNVELYFNSISNQYTLIIDNFSTDNGPALFVYLSQGRFALNFENLGALKALNGRLRYDFSGNNFNPNFDHILIWCDQVAQSFGEARLNP